MLVTIMMLTIRLVGKWERLVGGWEGNLEARLARSFGEEKKTFLSVGNVEF